MQITVRKTNQDTSIYKIYSSLNDNTFKYRDAIKSQKDCYWHSDKWRKLQNWCTNVNVTVAAIQDVSKTIYCSYISIKKTNIKNKNIKIYKFFSNCTSVHFDENIWMNTKKQGRNFEYWQMDMETKQFYKIFKWRKWNTKIWII